jgi:hypothetical protein
MLDIVKVKQDIEEWIVNFVEIPHLALGGWPPCPYAKKTRLEQDFDVRLGIDPYYDLVNLSRDGLGGKSVVIFVYNPVEWTYKQFSFSLQEANENYLLKQDILALEDHPDDPEWVNGICMNQGTYAMAMCQSISDLNIKAQHIASKGFYNTWPEEYLRELFRYREDPRK